MVRAWFFLALVSVGLVFLPSAASADEAKKADDTIVLAIQRSGGGFISPKDPLSQYGFKVTKDGSWEFTGTDRKVKKGKVKGDDLKKWLKAIKDDGFDKLKSNPALGAADEAFMDITIQAGDKKERKKIRLEEKLARAIEKKIVEVVKPGK